MFVGVGANQREGDEAMKLTGKVAFITGFGSGLGRAIAVRFASAGAAAAGTSTTESKGLETVRAIEQIGGRAFFRAGDVGSSKARRTSRMDRRVCPIAALRLWGWPGNRTLQANLRVA